MLCSIIAFGRFLGIDSTGISMLEVREVISKKMLTRANHFKDFQGM